MSVSNVLKREMGSKLRVDLGINLETSVLYTVSLVG